MSEWQDIETAPKDGSEFVAWCVETGRQGLDIVRWRDNYFQSRRGWIPTHWLPTPEVQND